MRCIRPLCEADVDAVVRLEEASFHTPWTRADFEGELKNPLALYLVVLEDDELIAYGGSWIVFDECHITNIAVTPSMRGAGVGSELMRELLSAAAARGGAVFRCLLYHVRARKTACFSNLFHAPCTNIPGRT